MTIRAIAAGDAVADFRCERSAEMVSFIATKALAAENAGYSRTYVWVDAGATQLKGFYTLSMYALRPDVFPSDEQRNLPNHQLPAALLGKLARDDRAGPAGASQPIGQQLLVDAIKCAVRAAKHVGCIGVVLHAKNQQLVDYYKKIGFRPIGQTKFPRLMILKFDSLKDPV